MSDIGWLFALATIFLVLGATLPVLQAENGQTSNQNYICKSGGIGMTDPSVCFKSSPSAWEDAGNILTIFLSMFTMFFWSFGSIPWYLDLFPMTILRLVFFFLLQRNLPTIEILGFKIGGAGGN